MGTSSWKVVYRTGRCHAVQRLLIPLLQSPHLLHLPKNAQPPPLLWWFHLLNQGYPLQNACLLYLVLQPRTFFLETVMVRFVISLLSNEPQSWAHHLLEQKNPAIHSVDAFFEAMAQLYDDPQHMSTAEETLHTLQQGHCPVEDFTVDFH